MGEMTMHDSAQALRGKKLLLVGFTLFSMFFGAGNLIFPPFLGAQAGTALWSAFVGFAVSAIGLPIAGVAAVARAGGLPALAGRVHPRFAQVFAVLVYLSIGPCLAIPRTASTSFEMLTPLVGRSTPGQFIYSLVFFAAAYFVALKPEKLTQRLGRILCPALLVLIVVLFAGCILRPAAPGYGTPAEAYAALPAAQGVLDGYQTMDALAALNFGAVIALNIQAVGITEEAAVRRGTIRAGLIAGGMLLVVYAMLTHIGGISGAAFPGSDTGASVLTALADGLFGRVGQVLLAVIFVIACFNTCVGLIASVGEYFHELLPQLSYPAIAAFFALMSMLLANIGLADILSLSVPVLNAIYPIAIVLIVVEFLPGRFQRTSVWRLSILFTAIQSIPAALPFGPLSTLMNALPLSSLGFGWLLPALIGIGAGLGTGSIAHACADTKKPVKQGVFGIFEVFADTIVICTLTALVILCSGTSVNYGQAAGAELTISGFTLTYGGWASLFTAVALCCFAFSTIIGWGLYGSRCIEYLFHTDKVVRPFLVVYSFVGILGATVDLGLLWSIADTFNGLMSIPNLIALLLLSGTVAKLVKEFFAKEPQ